jgi:Mrp family chromosome partitioning ATPase
MASLLESWRDHFRFIVVHGPAAIFADALVLAQMSDAVLLSVLAGQTTREEILPAFRALSRQIPDHAVLGVVLEKSRHEFSYARA